MASKFVSLLKPVFSMHVGLACSLRNIHIARQLKKATPLIGQESASSGVAPRAYISPNEDSTPKVVKKQQTYLQVELDNEVVSLNYMWLRENCQCPLCYDPKINGKYVDTLAMPDNICPAEVTCKGKQLEITWSDGHNTRYDMDWLAQNSQPEKAYINRVGKQVLWDAQSIKDCDVSYETYDKFMKEDESLKTFLKSLLVYGFAFVTEVPPDIEHSQAVAERICIVEESVYGKMYYIKTDPELDHVGLAYTNAGLGAHTDTPYYSDPNGLQQFHLLYHDGEGGDTLLVDGFNCAAKLKKNDPGSYRFLNEHRIPFMYKESRSEIFNLAHVLREHPLTGELAQIRYNKEDRLPVNTIQHEDLHHYYKAWNGLTSEIKSPENEYWFHLKPGTVLFTDNWRVLHGRSGFSGYRSLCGCYLNRDEYLSKSRILGLI